MVCHVSWNSEKYLLTVTHLLETDVIKDISEQPGEEVPRVRSGRVPSTGAFVSVALGWATSQHMDMFTSLEALNPIADGFHGGSVM